MKTFKGIVASLVLCLFSSSLQAPGIAADLMTLRSKTFGGWDRNRYQANGKKSIRE